MTSKELDERIEDLDVDMVDYQVIPEGVKQLIRDCIEAVTPERPSEITNNTLGAIDNTIDTIEANTKELLG